MGIYHQSSISLTLTCKEGGEEKQMKQWIQKVTARVTRKSGQSLIEYALILALIAVVAVVVLRGIGSSVNTTLGTVNSSLQ